jgi:pyruvate/2-oxoglutarate dehydrogenase complex dihydrolipoamide acyltransferase (E2) component
MIDVHIPKMGMSTVEVDILEVYVEVGEHVDQGEAVILVEAEKTECEIPSPAAGTVAEILVEEGVEREVGDIVARIQPDT